MSTGLSDDRTTTDSQANRSQVLAYLRTLPELPTEPPFGPKVLEPLPPATEIELDGIIHKQQQHAVRLTKQFDEFGVLEPTLHTLWPGAAVQGRSLLGNRLAPIGLARAPGVITATSLVPSTTARQSRTIERPSLATVQQAITDLLHELNPVASTGGKTEYAAICRTARHGLLAVDLNVNAGKLALDGDLSFESQRERSSVIWRLNQAYYTVSFEPSGSPAYFFDDTVTLDDLQHYAGPANPPCYVSSVTYGRMLLVLVTADTASETLKLALKAKYDTVADGKLRSEYDELLSQSTVRIFSVGSTGTLDLGVLQNPLAELNAYLRDGIGFSKDNPGAPITFRVNYIGNLADAKVSQTIDYQEIASVWAEDVHRDFEVWDGPGGGPKSTQIPVAPGDTVTITANGRIWSGLVFFGDNGPGGWEPHHKPPSGAPLPDARAFSLLGGWDNRDWFWAGGSWTGQSPGLGTRTLWLGLNDDNPYNGDPSKKFAVHVHVKRKQPRQLYGVGSSAT
jgi:Thiol-activated cytolysin